MYIKNLLVITCAILVTCCTFNKYDDLHPKKLITCDTSISVSYSKDIAPIMVKHCNNCHNVNDAATKGGGTFLDSYDDFSNNVEDVLKSISGKNYSMPKNSSKLDSCDIYAIQKWMDKNKPQ